MTFKPGDRVIVNNSTWTDEPALVVEHAKRFFPLLPGRVAVRIDSYGYIFEYDDHVVSEESLTLDISDSDAINPTHYQFPGGIQVIDLIRHLGFLEGNIVKYVARAGRKGAAKEDLLKARQYLDWLIEDTND